MGFSEYQQVILSNAHNALRINEATAIVYNRDKCKEAIERFGRSDLDHLYREIKDAKFLADFCSLAVLYHEGGYYIGINLQALTPIEDTLPLGADVTAAWHWEGHDAGLVSDYFGAVPRHGLVRRCLETLLRHKLAHTIENLSPLGPLVMREAFFDWLSSKAAEPKEEDKPWMLKVSADEARIERYTVGFALLQEVDGGEGVNGCRKVLRDPITGKVPFKSHMPHPYCVANT
eukprot:NODE_2449_length_932_cov_560.415051.p1 GENE.NODE_2449_length_932_cov_560.415051~~NODE_2449_length_932_cov_560.415051.p1  ORF type:complete len:232 (-),score=65.60 NODE_2449_length_932_cov_560.415051:219-914(-)